ncbi:MAG: CPBP family intramembrane metalloprotease [Verrucomicrobia bacterium]|nr:CPBP family intramembrane metalloprotease [Verrucomicrobiota bacterium]
MRPIRAILVYILSVFVGGALLAPWLYGAAQGLAQLSPSLQFLAEKPFHRYVSRSLMLIAVAGLWPFLRAIGIRSWIDLGIRRDPLGWRAVSHGFLLGFGSLALIVFIALLCDARSLAYQHTSARILRHLFNAGLAAIVVSLLEEVLFRGAIFGGLRRVMAWQHSLWVSSFIYALVHFLGRAEPVESIRWTSGFLALGTMAAGFIHFQELVPAFVNLALVGMILGIAFQRTGTLYFSIGLHAGWIFWLKSYGFLFAEKGSPMRSVWGSNKLIDGWLAMPILLLLLGFVLRRHFARDSDPAKGMD